ncbi:MAG: site-specific integrase [Candidatus Cryptobacteroides sp.]|nr:site-specific integrase [Candidatus Cryptobacteroides sp.]
MKFHSNTRLMVPHSGGRGSVVIRVSYLGKRVELYTGITALPSQWNEKKERIKQGCTVEGYQYNILNKKLTEQEEFVENYFNESELRSSITSLSDLKDRFNHRYKTSEEKLSDEFFFLFGKFREEMAEVKGWQKDMKDVYERLENKVKDFKADIKFADLSTETMDKFKVYLSRTMYNDALLKHLQYFKSFITWASKRNYKIHSEYFSYEPKLPKAKKAVRYLTIGELDTICNLTFEGREGLERARDIFVFQCYTALRVSDVSQLKRSNITQNENGEYIIDLLTEKDDDRVRYKLAKRAVAIYLKYKDNVYENDLVFPVISAVKYNEHLKELGKAADLKGEWIDYEYRLNEKITVRIPKCNLSTHTARRTFIVTAMNEGVSLDLIALITSHSDIKAMKPYIKMNARGADKVIDAVDKASQED